MKRASEPDDCPDIDIDLPDGADVDIEDDEAGEDATPPASHDLANTALPRCLQRLAQLVDEDAALTELQTINVANDRARIYALDARGAEIDRTGEIDPTFGKCLATFAEHTFPRAFGYRVEFLREGKKPLRVSFMPSGVSGGPSIGGAHARETPAAPATAPAYAPVSAAPGLSPTAEMILAQIAQAQQQTNQLIAQMMQRREESPLEKIGQNVLSAAVANLERQLSTINEPRNVSGKAPSLLEITDAAMSRIEEGHAVLERVNGAFGGGNDSGSLLDTVGEISQAVSMFKNFGNVSAEPSQAETAALAKVVQGVA
ncbi:MAG: hypothetical protein L6Q71_07935 [Planctomycetes bacterium]|nr:hypothetical protein [Planctomycetota bacterium]NUQ33355.1 hypothetical protein [Planctomycetaceae bacterium]